ncbi:MAG: nucleotidyltransferase domain-containing protein [Candidatus Methanoperedens sp.]|jgi:hypothetical protein|nr:nucleotidyltransferase domain-containing protein [Candidatus Methanoperedens sp.]PKL52712.1 MAG: DNA polymerase subunit beta [Candidatus Methanoperedenaceae archaeon HGW-Methanoperedenaceae-1]
MAGKESLKKDFSFLFDKEEVLSVLLFGSQAEHNETPRSDIDICIVAPDCDDRKGLLGEMYRNLDVYSKKYDVRFFEELPLYIQIQIIRQHEVIYVRDMLDLYEYFYPFRRLWDDQAGRQQVTKEEMAGMLG